MLLVQKKMLLAQKKTLLVQMKTLLATKKTPRVMLLPQRKKQREKMKRKQSRVLQWDEASSWEIEGDVEEVPWPDFRHKEDVEARKP